MTSPTPTRRFSRRTLALAGAALVVLVVAVVAVLLATGSDRTTPPADADSTSASSSPTPATPSVVPTNPPTPEPSGPTSDAAVGPDTFSPVGLTDAADFGDGVSSRLLDIEEIDGDGEGVGNIDGPALRVTVELANGTDGPISVDAAAVEVYGGPDLTPASPLDDASAAPFSGILDPGGSTTGVYVFTIPEDQRSEVTVQIAYQAGAPYLVFRGPVG